MSDYINKKEIYGIEKLLDTEAVRKSKTASWLMDQVLHDIQQMETADVVPVVYGEWMENENFNDGFWTCSACGFVSEADAAPYLYRYCPNCGAKMRAEG